MNGRWKRRYGSPAPQNSLIYRLDSLSGGQRQRCWIAMALAQQTATILLDEPTTWLDLRYQVDILELLQTLTRDTAAPW